MYNVHVCEKKNWWCEEGREIQSDCVKYMYRFIEKEEKHNTTIEAIKHFKWAGFKLEWRRNEKKLFQ